MCYFFLEDIGSYPLKSLSRNGSIIVNSRKKIIVISFTINAEVTFMSYMSKMFSWKKSWTWKSWIAKSSRDLVSKMRLLKKVFSNEPICQLKIKKEMHKSGGYKLRKRITRKISHCFCLHFKAACILEKCIHILTNSYSYKNLYVEIQTSVTWWSYASSVEKEMTKILVHCPSKLSR